MFGVPQHSSCMIMDKSEDNHVSLDSEDFKEVDSLTACM